MLQPRAAFTYAKIKLRQRSRIAIMLDINRNSREGLEQMHLQWNVMPARKMRRVDQDSVCNLQWSANRYTDGGDHAASLNRDCSYLSHPPNNRRKGIRERLLRTRGHL